MKRSMNEMGDEYLSGIREHLKKIGKHKAAWQAVLDAIEDIEIHHVWFDGSELNLSVAGGGSLLAAVMRPLRRLGFEPDSRPKAGDPSFSTRFRNGSGAVVYLTFSSKVCRRVQVGTKMVETPIYEVVCDEREGA